MTDRIKRLKIEDFRGATQPLDLEFDDSKSIVLIFGENGTGKSTIVDAIEFVGAGSTTFLDDWKLGKGKRKERYIPALGKELSDVSISLEFGQQIYTATLNHKGLNLCNTGGKPDTRVLRRKSLQAFIDADPAQRYKQVAAFLDIPQIEASEASLRDALHEAEKIFEMAVAANSQALENLQGLWEAEDSPGAEQQQTAEIWARQQAITPLKQLQATLAEQKAGVQFSENLRERSEELKTAEHQLTQAREELETAEQRLTEIESAEREGNLELVTLLQDAKAYLTKTPDTLCPVCEETTIKPTELAQRLGQRISRMNALKQASNTKNREQREVNSKQDRLTQAKEKLLDAAQAAQEHFTPEPDDRISVQCLRQTNENEALAQADQLHKQLVEKLEQFQSELENTRKRVNNLTSIRQYVKTLDEKSVEAKQKESLSKRLQQAVDIVEAKRKSYVESILSGIADQVDNLYQRIHSQKNIGQIKLKLDERQRGSLVYGVAFGEQQDIQPQPYYSESHLDTLGLCIFLALAKRDNASRTLVVLDDVLGSVDQQHLEKTLDMLMKEAPAFAQTVITTHYRPLREQFRFAGQPSTPVQLIELRPWILDQGIRTGKTRLYAQELHQQLQEDYFRRDVIASQAGHLFERLLEFISRTYRCKVPHIIEPRFSFGELASAPNKKLKDALKILRSGNGNTEEIFLGPLYDNLTQANQIRNLVGCHFNQWAGELADQDIRRMAELALEMADALICPHCGSLPTSDKSGSYWECHCKKTHLHPLQQPQ